ncbi:MAG: hypothetical protein HFH50_00050 [Lachnospiraceae bacterium]|nr:hypothetical protein [Lachnospiraceae bacterium]MCI9060133.1 hypothetical protein [Lachnospiraceae bacterium]
MKGYIEERAINIANYIIEENATVKQTAKKFGISKSTVHMVLLRRLNIQYLTCPNLHLLCYINDIGFQKSFHIFSVTST